MEYILLKYGVDEKWVSKLTGFVLQAIKNVKPSSLILNDSMDICEYVKIKKILWEDDSLSKYVNGVVCRKNLVDRKMATEIKDPKILLISQALEYERNDTSYTNMGAVLSQELHYAKTLKNKFDIINPSIIFSEKQVSRNVIDQLKQSKINVVCSSY